jgi:opacity protein-like surface antigen
VIVTTKTLGKVDRGKVVSALMDIPGVRHAEVREAEAATGPSRLNAARTSIPEPQSKWLPRGLLFSPLHADPRWPQFGAGYRHFTQGLNLDHVFAGNFGETFSLYRDKAPFGGEWDLGIQAGVFSIFDISSASIDLVNADYRVGAVSSYRNGRFSAFARVYHQSSHLGDEFLLGDPGFPRVNLSYEEVDAKLSYELFSWLRVYGGGGVIFHRFPQNLGVGTTQWGVELTSTRTYWGGRLRPVAYADFQCNERTNWEINRSILAGIQFENARIGDRQIQVLLEYYAGPSPDGQFYTQRVSWYGIGVHLYF